MFRQLAQNRDPGSPAHALEFMTLQDEVVKERIERALRFASNVLEEIDPPHRLSDVAIVARIVGASLQTWRRSGEVGTTVQTARWRTSSGPTVATLDPSIRPRPALRR